MFHRLAPSLECSPIRHRAAPAVRLVHFAEKVPPLYQFYYQCQSWLSLVKVTTNQIIYYTVIIYESLHVCRMNTWIAILPMLVVEYLHWFQGNWEELSLQSVRVHMVASLDVKFQSFSIVVQWTRRVYMLHHYYLFQNHKILSFMKPVKDHFGLYSLN